MRLSYIHIILVLLLSSCYSEDENTFIADPLDPRVPQYSEEGANTAGAYINEEPWVSRKSTLYSGFSSSPHTSGTMSFLTSPDSNGTLIAFQGASIYVGENQSRQSCSVGFFLKDFELFEPEDLFQLAGKRIELDGVESFGQVYYNSDFNSIGGDYSGSGILFVRRVARMGTHIEISGTFGFTTDQSNEDIDVFSGRFDYEVFEEQFEAF